MKPKTPQNPAGIRIDPAPSPPCASGPIPLATAAAAVSTAQQAGAPNAERDFLSRVRRLTVEGRRAGEGYWSPDGRRLAFVGDYQGRPTLWVRALDAEDARPLPATQGARRPFWSPDGRSIGFFAFTDLKRIDAGGGTPQTVSSIIAGTAAAWGAAARNRDARPSSHRP